MAFLWILKVIIGDRKVYIPLIPIYIMPKKKQYHKSKKVCIKCLECEAEICGISQAHAEAMLKTHKEKSKRHREIVKAFISGQASMSIISKKEEVQK